jgi:hypothetical protein
MHCKLITQTALLAWISMIARDIRKQDLIRFWVGSFTYIEVCRNC